MQVPRNFQQSPIFKFGVQHLSNKKVDNMDWQLLIKIDDHRHRKNKRVGYAFEAINKESIWIGLNLTSAFCLVFSFFFFLVPAALFDQVNYEQCTDVRFIRPTNSTFQSIFIKNGSYGTIHTFKNYFATVFSVSTKISSIQTNKTRSFWDAIAMAKAHQPQQFRKLQWRHFCKPRSQVFFTSLCSQRSKHLEKICNNRRGPRWQEQPIFTRLQYLRQQGMQFKIMVVPRVRCSCNGLSSN